MFLDTRAENSIVIVPIEQATWEIQQNQLSPAEKNWASLNNFTAQAGQVCLLPDSNGAINKILAGYDVDSFTSGVGIELGAWGLDYAFKAAGRDALGNVQKLSLIYKW